LEETVASKSAGSTRNHGGEDNNDPHATDDIFRLQTVDTPAMSFLKAPDAIAGALGNLGAHHSMFDSAGEHRGPGQHFGGPETFQRDAVGSLPKGWSDAALIDPANPAPKPSALVVSTTDAFGHPTKALATTPAISDSQGIYRPITSSDFYSAHADVRVDQFSGFDPTPDLAACGCPPGTEIGLDFPMQVGFAQLQGTTDLSHVSTFAVYASSETQTWQLFAETANVLAVIDLGLPVTLGQWYGVDVSLDAPTGTLHDRITNAATGAVLNDTTVSLLDFGAYDPAVDGVFDVADFIGGEISLNHGDVPKTPPGLAVIDNIAVRTSAAFAEHGDPHPQGLDSIWSANG
jgi:hypothetical protein